MCCFFATSALALCPKAVLLWVFSLGLCFPPPTTLHCCLRTPLLRNLHLNSSTALPHYKQVPAFSVHTSEQTVHASQNVVCPVPWTHKKERKCRRTQALKRMSSAVAQERAYPTNPPEHNAPFSWTSSPQAPPAQRQQWILKSHPIFCSSLKTTKLSNERRVVCLQHSTAGSSNNGNDWFVIPGIIVLLPGYHLWRHFADRMPDSKCEGSKAALPGRKGIDYQSLFLPGRISLLQFILFNGLSTDSLQMALGGSEGNDTRDYKSITIIEPFIW